MLITTEIVVICVVLTAGISGAPVANSTKESECQNVVYNVHTVQTLNQGVIIDLFIIIIFFANMIISLSGFKLILQGKPILFLIIVQKVMFIV